MITDISKITLENINDFMEKPYQRQLKDKKQKLLLLLKEKEYVTSKDIREKIYNGRDVKRQTIGQLIRRLRDEGYKIQTIAKVGYKLRERR
jgi:biotin operon repressor